MSNRVTCTQHSQRAWKAGNATGNANEYGAVYYGRRTNSRFNMLEQFRIMFERDDMIAGRVKREEARAILKAQQALKRAEAKATSAKGGMLSSLYRKVRGVLARKGQD